MNDILGELAGPLSVDIAPSPTDVIHFRPRRQIKYPVELLRGTPPAVYDNVPIDGVLKTLPPFALFHINRYVQRCTAIVKYLPKKLF